MTEASSSRLVFQFVLVSSCLLGLSLVTMAQQRYDIPKQTAAQAQAYETLSAQAQVASEAATPELLAYLDTPSFRDSIANLPEDITSLSSEELLVLLNETVALSVITHGIYASAWSNLDPLNFDVTLEQLIQYNLTFIPNIWQRIALGLLNATTPFQELATLIENAAETHLLLLPEFNTTNFADVTLEEGSDRISYTAIDIYRLSESGQYFGNMQMVLNPSYAKPMMIVSPYDTGHYATCCVVNSTLLPPHFCDAFNISKGQGGCTNLTMGTLYHLSHLYLQNQRYWGVPLITNLLQRFFAHPMPLASLAQEAVYFEGDLLGNILFPDALQYVIGDFSTLFGKEQGATLQTWCVDQGVPLVWTLAVPNAYYGSFSHPNLTAQQNQSFIDPVVLPASFIANISTADQDTALELFSLAWKLIDTTLAANASLQNSTIFWKETFEDVFTSIPLSLHLNPLKPFQCDDTDHCFGVDDSNNCLCRYPPGGNTN